MRSPSPLSQRTAACLALTVLAVVVVALLVLNMERSSTTAATLGAAIAVTAAATGPRWCRPKRWRRAPVR